MKRLSEFAIKILPCSDAQAFMAALSPSNPLWGHDPTDWIFRGHSVSDWLLLPTALRPGNLKFHKTQRSVLDEDSPFGHLEEKLATDIVLNEFYHIKDFFEVCDDHGLHIPGDSYEHRTIEGLNELGTFLSIALHDSNSPTGFVSLPTGPWLYVYALAQHYGIKTRLLDWTRRPRVAAYFAARQVAEEVANSKHEQISLIGSKLCVWALNKRKLLINHSVIFNETKYAPYVRFVRAPQASNPNLNAQAGLFVVDGCPRRRIPLDQLILDGLDKISTESIPDPLRQEPLILTKIELPYLHARTLLRLLAKESVTAASVYPGYHGAASALQERAFWD